MNMRLTGLLIVLSAAMVWGGGFETAGIGTRQMNMGGAAIGLADDWTAIFWNPAGLAFMTGSQVGFDIRMSQMTQTADQSLRNIGLAGGFNPSLGDFPIPFGPWAAPGAEPTRYSEDTISDNQFRPDVGWYKAFDSFTLGIGFYGSGGLGAEWSDSAVTAGGDLIKAEYSTAVAVMNVPVAFGMKLGDRQAVGGSLQILYGFNSTDNSKVYTDVDGPPTTSYRYDSESDGTGYGMEVDLGYMLKLTDTLTVGALYRSHYVLHAPGEAKMGFTGGPPAAEESDMEMIMDYPQRAGVGAAWKPSDALTLTGDLYYINWSAMDINLVYDDEGVWLNNRRVSDDMMNTWPLRLGCEYKQSAALAWRFGYYSDPSPYPADYATLVQSRFPNAEVLAAGVGYTRGTMSYHAMLNYTLVHPRTGNSNEIDGSVSNLALGMLIGL
ncbi:MAG: outer membrane protein transport protein [Planctomycetota bacterium]